MSPDARPTSPPATRRASVIDRVDDLAAIEAPWRDLAVAAGNPFMTPEWFHAWREANPAARPVVVVVHGGDGAPRGLLPLVLGRRRGRRELHFAGDDLGDNFGLLVPDGEDADAVAAAAGEALRRHRPRPQAVRLAYVPVGARWPAALAARLPLARAHDLPRIERPLIAVDGLDWTGYLAGRQRNFRKELRRLRRRLEEGGEAAWRVPPAAELTPALAALWHLHDVRWGAGSKLADPRRRAVLDGFCARAAARGWLRLGLLELAGRPVAAELAWRVGDRQIHYQGGFDPALLSRGVGVTAMGHAIEDGWEEGVREFDLCRGTSEYKLRFATGSAEARSVLILTGAHPARFAAEAAHLARHGLGRRLPEPVRRGLAAARAAVRRGRRAAPPAS